VIYFSFEYRKKVCQTEQNGVKITENRCTAASAKMLRALVLSRMVVSPEAISGLSVLSEGMMHETALMQDLLSIAENALQGQNVKQVNTVKLAVGTLANAMPDALIFAFEAMTQSGLLQGATLEMVPLPVKARCESCGHEYEPTDFPFLCPVCQSIYYTITQGEDIYIISLDCEKWEDETKYH